MKKEGNNLKGNICSRVLQLLKRERWLIAAQCLFGIIQSVLSIFLIYKIASLTDLVTKHDYDGFIKALPVFFIAITLQVFSYYFEKRAAIKCKAQISNNIRNLIGSGIIHTSLEIKEKHGSANILSLFNNQIELIQDYIGDIAGVVIKPIIAVIACIYFASISFKLLIVSCILIPVSTVIYNYLSKPIQRKTKEILDEKTGLNIITKDVIDGFYAMKAFGLQRYFLNKYSDKVNVIAQREKEKDKINSTLGRIFILLRYIPQLIIPLYGGYLSFVNEITLGQLIAANTIIWHIILPIEALLDIMKKTRTVKPALDDVFQIIELEQEESTEVSFKEANDVAKELELQDLAFAYESGENVLKDINLELSKKEHIKVIGGSGAGKSTLLKVICGLYTGFKGNVKFRGAGLTSKNAMEIRKLISYVPQHPYIFQETIEKNISMGKNVSRQCIIEAARLADADKFIEALPDGYDTLAGSGGVKLSGGQCKRLAIARAIIKDGALFIFDEPTSALDMQSENRVHRGFYEICKEKCSIVVTHRMGLVGEKDKVMRLSEGSLYEG